MRLNIFMRVCSDTCKSLARDSTIFFSVTLMCCYHRDVSLLTRVQPSQQDTVSCDYTFTGSKYALCIHPSAMGLSVNANMCETCPSCRIVIYIDIADARNYNRFSVSFLCYSSVTIQRHAKPFFL